MDIYENFAYFYAKGPYTKYSEKMAELLPRVLERFNAKPQKILDIACGEGTFAVSMAKKGFKVTGIDISPQMVRFAKERAEKEKVHVKFTVQDMRDLHFKERFDLVTCWFDSLNYLLEQEDLKKTFEGVYRVLKKGGFFIFDMNTIYALAVIWQKQHCWIEQDTPELFEIHSTGYDFEKNIATLKITGFRKRKKTWVRIDEEHKERGYTIGEIRQCLKKLQEVACLGNIQEMKEGKPDDPRIWFITRK